MLRVRQGRTYRCWHLVPANRAPGLLHCRFTQKWMTQITHLRILKISVQAKNTQLAIFDRCCASSGWSFSLLHHRHFGGSQLCSDWWLSGRCCCTALVIDC